MDANFENEIDLVEHLPYYNDNDFKNTVSSNEWFLTNSELKLWWPKC